MHLVLFLDFQKHPMRRGAQNMPVFKARGTIEGHKDGGRGDLKGQKEKNTGTGLYKQDWLPNMGGCSERYALHAEKMEEFLGKASINLCFLNIIHYKLLVK